MSTAPAERPTNSERNQRFANMRPKDAATLILIDRSGPTFKVLMGRRHNGHAFLPGKFVFPGGRVEVDDRRVPVTGALDAYDEARLMRRVARASRLKARAFAVAAIREAFEETGLMIGRKVDGPPTLPEGWLSFAHAHVNPTSASCISSPAPSPHRVGPAASTRASSRPMRSPSRTGSKASWVRMPSSLN